VLASAESVQTIVAEGRWDDLGRLVDTQYFSLLLTVPSVLGEALRSAPEGWLHAHPRYLMAREIASIGSAGAGVIGDEARRTFEDWVASTPRPAARDVLGIQQAELRFLLAAGRFADASTKADEALATIQTATDTFGFLDILPSTLIRIGMAKLLSADLRSAVKGFAEAARWASASDKHPAWAHAENYLALALALSGEYVQANEHLQPMNPANAQPGDLGRSYEAARATARGLIALGTLDQDTVTDVIAEFDDELAAGELWWVASHIKAITALLWGDRATAIAELEADLLRRQGVAGAASFAGALIRADLASLYQADGNLVAARHVLHPKRFDANDPFLLPARARLDLLQGRPEEALARLADAESVIARLHHTSVMLLTIKAAAQTLLHGASSAADALIQAAAAIGRTGATRMVAEAPHEVRYELARLTALAPESLPQVFPKATAPDESRSMQLTRRERDVIRALELHSSIRDVAAALHVSPNTAKTHLHAVYRKLAVNTRDEILRLTKHNAD
jgi:DNA-binding NarL/FixJ family response regulator